CSGTTYNPDGAGTDLTYGIDQTTINVGTLYAMWEEDIIHLQGLNYTECLGDDKVAIDSRDQNDYTISTLGDGACWMTQNLRLGSNGEMITLTNSDSDVTSSFSFTSAPAWSGVFTSANVDTAQAYYSGDTSLGSYYNWYTATASTGNSSTAADIEAHSSICPKGWVLPNRAEYAMLLGQYGNDENKLWSPALPNYVITGYYKDTLHNQSTTHTYAWERTAKSASSGDDMFLRIGKATATDGMNKYYGMPVRCRLGGDKTSFTVIYNANGGTGTMSSQTTNTGSITLSSNSFTRPNYAFLGWSNDSSDTNPKFYAGSTIVSYTDTLNVYAVWRQVYSITFNKDSNVSSIEVLDSDGNIVGTITSSEQSLTLYKGDTYTIKPTYATRYAPNVFEKTSGVGTFTKQTGYIGTFTVGAGTATINVTSQYVDTPMQNYSCSNIANVGNTKYIYDTRDNEVYLVGKLADNKCWMLDNLRFDIVAHKDDISSSNTNITNSATLTSLKSGNRSAGNNYATAGVSYWGTNSYSAPQIAIQGKNEDDNEWDSNTTATSYGNGSGKIGVYYNYCAASAGSYCYSKNAAPEDDTSASQDICPAGWRMPTSGNSGEYAALLTAYNNNETATDTGSLQYNLSTPLSGHFYYGSAYLQDLYGRFWSSTRHDGSYMYYLYVSSSYVNPQYGYSGDRDYGFPVRCLLQ
ncbi:InlB B-repeat-containing protein, partial [Candidatus Saccharibacteria bacterium]|nr:InlB B-repeat-containing protein [Candidatus Saccharibacteria bacterium]